MSYWKQKTGTPKKKIISYDHYVYLDGSSYISTPDSWRNSVAGSIDIIVKVSSNDWTSSWQAFISKGATGGNFGFEFGISSSSSLELWLSQNGSSTGYIASGAVPFVDGQTYWIRVTYNTTTTIGVFYQSTNYDPLSGSGSWAIIASPSNLSYTSLYDSTGYIYLGCFNGGVEWLNGKIYYAEVRDGIDGEIVARFNASDTRDGGETFENRTFEQLWTNNGGILNGFEDPFDTAGSLGSLWNYFFQGGDEVVVTSGSAGVVTGSTESFSVILVSSFSAYRDQYAQCTIDDIGSTAMAIELNVRTSELGGYTFYVNSNGYGVYAQNASQTTYIPYDTGTTFTTGDIIKITSIGTTITLYKNGSAFDSFESSDFSSGQPGFNIYTYNGTSYPSSISYFIAGSIYKQ